ncbi:chromodomain-helicase-DNA-binding protein 2-like, partial [Sceloporus undulatus]|uniref:chromodomain-helicase-DNA-binding protein 2-like n=1 Tax=Sceloporus undulatus TaxID=8520 RepID=UPI001C4C8E95
MDRFCLTCRIKSALLDVQRGLEEDSRLLLGTDKQGNRNLELIKSVHDLKLTNKVEASDSDSDIESKLESLSVSESKTKYKNYLEASEFQWKSQTIQEDPLEGYTKTKIK